MKFREVKRTLEAMLDDTIPACGDEHWLGFSCQAHEGHEGRCRYYEDGARYEWNKPGKPEGEEEVPWQMIVVVREGL